MNFTALLLLLGMMGTGCSSYNCGEGCKHAHRYEKQYVRHISKLDKSSVAPWKYVNSSAHGSPLNRIKEAVCGNCTITGMMSLPIYIQIQIFKFTSNGTHDYWCRCDHKLPVGCTCVDQTAYQQ